MSRRTVLLFQFFLALAHSSAFASIIWTYDFPGTPGSGLAADQTNPQPGHATFGDWNRINLSAVGTADVFNSSFWNTTSTFDSTQYASFSITADAGYHLNLSLLTFDEMRESGGPTKGRIQMFLNGSTTAYATFDYNPTASLQNKTFDFTDTTDADNVTLVEFRFYGWNGGTPSAGLLFDNVGVTLTIVPEPNQWLLVVWPVGVALRRLCARRRRA
jgi:hypothetical protein